MNADITYPNILHRLMIVLYDALLIMAVSMAYGLVAIGVGKVFGMEGDRAGGALFQLGWFISVMGFYCYFWTKGQQTTGMRAWRVKLVNLDGGKATLTQALIRWLLCPLGWALFATSIVHPRNQFLHDVLSKTQFIREAKEKKKNT